jgi:hypothetical protein
VEVIGGIDHHQLYIRVLDNGPGNPSPVPNSWVPSFRIIPISFQDLINFIIRDVLLDRGTMKDQARHPIGTKGSTYRIHMDVDFKIPN